MRQALRGPVLFKSATTEPQEYIIDAMFWCLLGVLSFPLLRVFQWHIHLKENHVDWKTAKFQMPKTMSWKF